MALVGFLERELHAEERRKSPRRRLWLEASGATRAGLHLKITVHDISSGGLLIETAHSLGQGDQLEVILPEVGAKRATVVWSSGHYFGCRFSTPITAAAVCALPMRSYEVAGASPAQQFSDTEMLDALSAAVQKIAIAVDRAVDRLSLGGTQVGSASCSDPED
jgi:PilZ domain